MATRSAAPLVLLIAAAALGKQTAPCADSYAEWVAKPEVFIRSDAPRHMQGLHVVCVWRDDAGIAQLEAYTNAVDRGEPLRASLPEASLASWKAFRAELKSALGFKKSTNHWGHVHLKQPFGLFAETGRRLSSAEEALEAQLVFVIEGGQWFWPPLREGHVRKLPGTSLELETLSVQPVIFRVHGFLQEHECERIVKLGEPGMHDSGVSLMDKDKGKAAKQFRTSTQSRPSRTSDKLLNVLGSRVANLTRVPEVHNEEVQILRYHKTQYYSAHLDNWDPDQYKGGQAKFIDYGYRNRMITVFWYLSNVTEGGETLFPRAMGLPQPRDMYSCESGLKVKPVQGSIIFWYSLHPNGNNDANGLHAACPVIQGTKRSANFWVWNQPYSMGASDVSGMPDAGVDEPEPGEEEVAPAKRHQASNSVTALFENSLEDEVALFWRGNGAEVSMGNIAPGERKSFNSFPGHRFVARKSAAGSGEVVAEFVVSSAAEQLHHIKGRGEL